MNKTIDPNDFEKAIQEKDYSKIKSYIINSIRNNPYFITASGEHCEAIEACSKLKARKKELPGLFEKYVLQDNEVEFDPDNKDSWNYEYFINQTFYLGENFCKERLYNIKEIGVYLKNFQKPQEAKKDEECISSDENNIDEVKRKKTIPSSIAKIVIIAVSVLLIGLLVVYMVNGNF